MGKRSCGPFDECVVAMGNGHLVSHITKPGLVTEISPRLVHQQFPQVMIWGKT